MADVKNVKQARTLPT